MKSFAITTVVWLVMLGDGSQCLARCDAPCPTDGRVKAEASAAAARSETPSLPANVSVPNNVKRVLQAAWKRSPTFRRQCRRIGEAGNLRIQVSLVPRLALSRLSALSTVRRREDGMITVKMKIRALSDYVEIIAHEFEHMLEQLEGLDLRALAAQGNSGVYRNELDAYETARAVNAGRRVFDEYRRGDDCQTLAEVKRPAQPALSCD